MFVSLNRYERKKRVEVAIGAIAQLKEKLRQYSTVQGSSTINNRLSVTTGPFTTFEFLNLNFFNFFHFIHFLLVFMLIININCYNFDTRSYSYCCCIVLYNKKNTHKTIGCLSKMDKVLRNKTRPTYKRKCSNQ